MEIGQRTIGALLTRMEDHGSDYASEYGEPGYQTAHTAGVITGYYWCQCENGPTDETYRDGTPKLHGLEYHYPRVFAALEEQGYGLEWSDEWYVGYETQRAWRTQGNSYSWQPSIVWHEEWCDYLTPDDDLETWIEGARDDVSRCIPSRVWNGADLILAGFEQYERGNPHTYESGWHPGQTDNPEDITRDIRRWMGDDVEIVFLLDATGQFDIRFSAWTRGGFND